MQKVCVVCRNTGKSGAGWLAVIGSVKDPVHRPCGERLVEHAKKHGEPQARLIRGEELRQKHLAEAQERQVQAVWAERFQKAGLGQKNNTANQPKGEAHEQELQTAEVQSAAPSRGGA